MEKAALAKAQRRKGKKNQRHKRTRSKSDNHEGHEDHEEEMSVLCSLPGAAHPGQHNFPVLLLKFFVFFVVICFF